jgi:hypothetical protein
MLPTHRNELAAPEAPRRRFHQLRIAWSVGWGLVAVLLIVLWARSYSKVDSCRCPTGRHSTLHIQSASGRIIAFVLPYSGGWKTGSIRVENVGPSDVLKSPVMGTANYVSFYNGASRIGVVPYWAAFLPVAAIAAAISLPWIRKLRYRFSLRTLLIVTTLIALLLGLIVWLR